jgi:hypothetical protein
MEITPPSASSTPPIAVAAYPNSIPPAVAPAVIAPAPPVVAIPPKPNAAKVERANSKGKAWLIEEDQENISEEDLDKV